MGHIIAGFTFILVNCLECSSVTRSGHISSQYIFVHEKTTHSILQVSDTLGNSLKYILSICRCPPSSCGGMSTVKWTFLWFHQVLHTTLRQLTKSMLFQSCVLPLKIQVIGHGTLGLPSGVRCNAGYQGRGLKKLSQYYCFVHLCLYLHPAAQLF